MARSLEFSPFILSLPRSFVLHSLGERYLTLSSFIVRIFFWLQTPKIYTNGLLVLDVGGSIFAPQRFEPGAPEA